MTYRFKPLPDITVYELAVLLEAAAYSGATFQDLKATDELIENISPKCLRRHFEKLPPDLGGER